MKKGKILLVLVTVIFILLIFIIEIGKNNNKVTNEIINSYKKEKNLLTMNLEQTEGLKDYKQVTQSHWPTDGYKLNKERSGCENGGTLSWDDINKTVILEANVSDKCYVYFDIWVPTIEDYCKKTTNLATCIKEFGNQGSDISSIYIHSNTLTNGAGDNSYRYAGGDYKLTDKAIAYGLKSMVTSDNTATDGLINLYCNEEKRFVGDQCSSSYTKYYTLQYDDTNTQYQTYNEALEKAVEDGYLSKNNIKNFLCFGSNETPCPENNLYRIIGVIDDKVKLVKYDFATTDLLGTDGTYQSTVAMVYTAYRGNQTNLPRYSWHDAANIWHISPLNTTNLNTNFINNIGNEWANKIATSIWKVGGNTYSSIAESIPSIAYSNEITNSVPVNSTIGTDYEGKVGLIYISDYGFAASPDSWTSKIVDYNNATIRSNNWMYTGTHELTITRVNGEIKVNFILNTGSLQTWNPVSSSVIHPSFYLESSIMYISGTGSIDNPIIIN